MMMLFHDVLVYAVAALCLWAIVAPAIPSCIFGTAGLCLVGVGALLTLDDNMQPALDMVLLGVLLGGLQIVWRAHRARRNRHMRRMSDWAPKWQPPEPPREVDITTQRRVSGGKKQ